MRPDGPWHRLLLHGGKDLPADFRGEVARLREEGHRLDVRPTFEGGDGAALAREALTLGVDVLIAAGGDGLVHEVASALVDATSSVELGVVPLGTGNDLATAAGLPIGDPGAALRAAVEAEAFPVDLVRAGDRSFLNMATGGFGTRFTTETSPELKRAIGKAAYLFTALTRPDFFSPAAARLVGPDLEWEGSFLALGIGNGRTAGGGVPLCPRASIDDGLLDVVVLEASEPLDVLVELLAQGTAEDLPEHEPPEGPTIEGTVRRWRLPWVEVQPVGVEAFEMNLDGEPFQVPSDAQRFEVLPRSLRLRLPATSPLLAANAPAHTPSAEKRKIS